MENFDLIAPFYDTLSRLVFGKTMRAAQTKYLSEIPPGGTVFILGGGTGWLLAELAALHPTCKIWYVEASEKMINLSKRKLKGVSTEIVFIQGTENALPSGVVPDAIITNFFFDLFSTEECGRLVDKIKPLVHVKSIWLISDFIRTTWWHSAMLTVMYRFFRIVSGLKTNTLPQWENVMTRAGFREIKSQRFYNGFIKSSLFRSERKMN